MACKIPLASTNSEMSFALAFFGAGRQEDLRKNFIVDPLESFFNRSPILLLNCRHQYLIYFTLLFPFMRKFSNIIFK